MISYSEDARKPIFVRIQRFTEEAVDKVEKAISDAHQVHQPILPIVIDSTGGCAYSLLAISEMIRESHIKIATIVESRALSCGAILFTCGHQGYRFIGQNGIIAIHDVRSSNAGKVEDIKADARESDRINNILYEMMAKNCGQEKDYFKNLVHENSHADLYFTAEDCIKHNIANHIKVPKLKIKVKVEYELC
jgi:ATP-dependent protease ClpP protease subunit